MACAAPWTHLFSFHSALGPHEPPGIWKIICRLSTNKPWIHGLLSFPLPPSLPFIHSFFNIVRTYRSRGTTSKSCGDDVWLAHSRCSINGSHVWARPRARAFESGWDHLPDCSDSLLLPDPAMPPSPRQPTEGPLPGPRLQTALDFPTQTQVRAAPGSDATRNTEHRGSINKRRSLRKGPPAAPPRPSRRASSREEAASATELASLCRPDYSESQEN